MDLATWIEWIVKALIMIVVLLTGFAYTTYMERKFLARFQSRYGPNRAGPFGLLQPVADGVKLIFKEELVPAQADKLIFTLAPDHHGCTGLDYPGGGAVGDDPAFWAHDRHVNCREPECRDPVYRLDYLHFSVWHRAGGLVVQ